MEVLGMFVPSSRGIAFAATGFFRTAFFVFGQAAAFDAASNCRNSSLATSTDFRGFDVFVRGGALASLSAVCIGLVVLLSGSRAGVVGVPKFSTEFERDVMLPMEGEGGGKGTRPRLCKPSWLII